MDNSNPEFREREWNGKKTIPKIREQERKEKTHSQIREREGNEKKQSKNSGTGREWKKKHSRNSGTGRK